MGIMEQAPRGPGRAGYTAHISTHHSNTTLTRSVFWKYTFPGSRIFTVVTIIYMDRYKVPLRFKEGDSANDGSIRRSESQGMLLSHSY